MNKILVLLSFLCFSKLLCGQDSLRLYLKFNNTLMDESTFSHHGFPLNSVNYIDDNCETVLEIRNNTTDAVALDRAVFNQMSDFTVSFLAKIDGLNTNNNIISCANNSQANEFLIGYNSVNDAFMDGWHMRIDNTLYFLGGDISMNDFSWHHIVITRDENIGALFIDGQQIGNSIIVDDKIFDVSLNGAFIGQDQDCLGGCFQQDQSWFGKIDELKVFSKALNIEEIFQVFCPDCNDTSNGLSIIDDCGDCNEPDSPDFNQSCADCSGFPNGTAIIDDCGECNEPTSPDFNQSCTDCFGVLNGIAVIDNCGTCLDPNDPDFNQSCIIEHEVFIPNIFSPNDDGVNDRFQIFAKDGVIKEIREYIIYDRWGEQVYKKSHFDILSNSEWWKGKFRGQKMQSAIFVYSIEVEFIDGFIGSYSGDVLLLH